MDIPYVPTPYLRIYKYGIHYMFTRLRLNFHRDKLLSRDARLAAANRNLSNSITVDINCLPRRAGRIYVAF